MNYYLFLLDYLHGILMEIPVILSEMSAARFMVTYPGFHGQHLGVNRLGCDEQMQPAIVNRPAGTGDVLFMFFRESVSLGLRTRIIETLQNTLMLWGQGSAHYYGNANVPWRHSWIHVCGPLVSSLVKGRGLRFDQAYPLKDGDFFDRFLEDVYAELNGDWQPDELILSNLLESFLKHLHRIVSAPNSSPPPRHEIARVRQFLEGNFAEPLSVPQMAALAGMSVAHFTEEFCKGIWRATSPLSVDPPNGAGAAPVARP